MVHKTITLVSHEKYGRRPPPKPVGQILSRLPETIRGAILMSTEGRSVSSHLPKWLVDVSDIRFIDISGDSDTILHFDAPIMGETAPGLYSQKEFWSSLPSQDSTGFDIFADTLRDVNEANKNSSMFDQPLLSKLRMFKSALNGDFQEILVHGEKESKPWARVDKTTIDNAQQLSFEVPVPREVLVTGILDMVRASTRSFEIRLQDSNKALGVLVEGEMDSLLPLFDKPIIVQGKAVYRPSGRLLRIDALSVASCGEISPTLSKIPPPDMRTFSTKKIRKHQTPKSGVNVFFGTWPGNETDEELLQALEEVR